MKDIYETIVFGWVLHGMKDTPGSEMDHIENARGLMARYKDEISKEIKKTKKVR